MRWLTPLLLLSILLCFAWRARGNEDPRAATLIRLKKFVEIADRFRDHPDMADRQGWLATGRLNQHLRNDELETLEGFAVSPEAKGVRWPLGAILVQRNRFDAAAHVFTFAVAEAHHKDPQYLMWKWWFYNFHECPNYEELNAKIGLAIVRRFERADAAERLVIAQMFGKGEKEAAMSYAEFRKELEIPEDLK